MGGSVNQIPNAGALTINAPAIATLGQPGELDEWSFFGRAGEVVTIVVNPGNSATLPVPSPTLDYAGVQVLDSSGNVLASSSNTNQGAPVTLENLTLPTDGTYQILVRAAVNFLGSTGNYGVSVWDAPSRTSPVLLDQTTYGHLETPYTTESWTFSVTAETQIRFHLINEATNGIQFALTGPAGFTGFSGLTTDSDLLTLPVSGIYTLVATSSGTGWGAYAFSIQQTSLTDLTANTSYSGSLPGNATALLFQVTVPPNQQLLVTLQDPSTSDQNEVYLEYGAPPTRSDYQYRFSTPASANQQVLVPSPDPGSWYILVYSNYVPAPSTFTLTAATGNMFLLSGTPTNSGNSMPTIMTLTGSGFTSTTQVSMVTGNGTAYPATELTVVSPTQLIATFAAGTVPVGTYTVQATQPDGSSADLLTPFKMGQGGEAKLKATISIPNPIGYHIASTIYIQYSNVGDVAMPAPLLVLTATMDGNPGALMTLNPALQVSGFWTSAVPAGYSQSVQILASGAVPGLLEPGETETVPVYYAGWLESEWDFSRPEMIFSLGSVDTSNTDSIDWSSLENSLQPSSLNTNTWNAIYPALTTQLGSTWGAYVQRLDQDAAYLGSLGENVTDVSQLLSFEIQQANGINPVQNLTTATDVSVQVPGLPLSITRSFSSTVASRNTGSPFGMGWVLGGGWDQGIQVQYDGTVIITNSNSSQRIFQPNTQSPGSYFAQPGDYGTLAEPSNGNYTLTEQDGQVTDFWTTPMLLAINGQNGYQYEPDTLVATGGVYYIQDANGNRITAGYTDETGSHVGGGQLISLTDSSGQWIHLAYNSDYQVTTLTDSEGQETTYTYDASGQYLLSVTQYLSLTDTVGYTTSYTYSDSTNPTLANALMSVTNPDGTQQLFSYDSEGRLMEISGAGGAQPVTFSYGIGGTVSATDADGGTTTYCFDNKGLLAKLTDPLNRTTLYTYDANGNLVQVTDPAGQDYVYQYNSQGLMVQSTDPLGDTTKFTYGSLDTLTSVTDPNGNTTQYQYDQNGDLTSTIYADGTVEKNAFNPIGEITQATDGNGNVVNYTYNSAGQILTETYSDGTQTTFAYDSYGNLISATDSAGTTTLTYDSANDLTEIQYPDGMYLEYTYDAAGRRVTMTDQTGFTVTYSYNSLGQLSGLSDGSGSIVSYTYDAVGRLSEEVKGNGTYTKYTYDADGEILSLINYAPGGAVNSSFVYTYNDLGLCTTETTIDGQWVYTYDATGQLTEAVFTPNAADPDGVASQNLQYVYDAAGNRTESIENGVVTTYTVNDMNQYTSTTTVGVGTTTYQYDDDGNLISEESPTGTTTYTYNVEDRLIGITCPAGSSSYQYDEFGNRVAETVNGQTTHYVIDLTGLGNVVSTYNANGLIDHYTYGLGLISQVNLSSVSSYYDFDALGSTVSLTGSNGQTVNKYTYLPFGEPLSISEAISNPFQFIGQWGVMSQPNTLSCMQSRWYSSALGDFASPDTAGILNPKANYYTYAGASPTNLIDPFGLLPSNETVIINAGLGALEGAANTL